MVARFGRMMPLWLTATSHSIPLVLFVGFNLFPDLVGTASRCAPDAPKGRAFNERLQRWARLVLDFTKFDAAVLVHLARPADLMRKRSSRFFIPQNPDNT